MVLEEALLSQSDELVDKLTAIRPPQVQASIHL
jgi:hypothetical protein